jgi:hypothetical protein
MNRFEHARPLPLLCIRQQSLPHRIGSLALGITVRTRGLVFRRDVVRGREEAYAESVGVEWPVADYGRKVREGRLRELGVLAKTES